MPFGGASYRLAPRRELASTRDAVGRALEEPFGLTKTVHPCSKSRSASSTRSGLADRRTGAVGGWRVPRLAGVAALVAAVTLAPSARGEPSDLRRLVADVIRTNPIVREQVHVNRQVLQDYQVALAGWRPSLDVTAKVGGISRKAPNTLQERRDYGSYDADVRLTQNIFSGFDTTYQIEQTQARITAEAFRLLDPAS